MSTHPKIAIIGAGPGGLALANILHNHKIPFVVYESDKTPHERNQGGSLDLHPRTGQLALREAGLWEEFVNHARPEADVMKIFDQKTGTALWDGNGPDAVVVSESEKFDHRPEIDREALRGILLEPLLKAGRITWGVRIESVVRGEGDKIDLHFKDGSVEKDFDLVVGADGAWSKVRRLLTDVQPFYSGISAIEMWAMDVDNKNPWLAEFAGKGNCFSFAEGRAIQMQRQGDGSVRTYALLRKPESFLEDCGIDWTKSDSAREQYINTYFNDCSHDVKRALLQSSDKLIPRPLYMLPVGLKWESQPGLALLGDAAHLMTPFAGVGVNAALTDALELARALIAYTTATESSNLADAIKLYEAGLFPRGEEFARKTERGLKGHFSAGGNDHMVARLRAAYSRA